MMNVIVIHNITNRKYPGENKQVKNGISDDSCIFCPNLSVNPHHKAIPFNRDSRL